MAQLPATWLLAASERVYRLLLVAYPPAFRRAFGPHMAQVFRDCCRATLQQSGTTGLIHLWIATLGDLIATALKERFVEPRVRHIAASESTAATRGERSKVMFRIFQKASRPTRQFDTLTRRAKQALALAAEEARALNHPYLGTEHILLGLIREDGGVAAHVLSNLGVTLAEARNNVEAIVGMGDRPAPECLAMTSRAKRVMVSATDEANRLKHNFVGTEHVLLGLVCNGEGVASGVLERMEVPLNQVRDEVLRVLRQKPG